MLGENKEEEIKMKVREIKILKKWMYGVTRLDSIRNESKRKFRNNKHNNENGSE